MPIVTRIWFGAALLLILAAVWVGPALVGAAIEPPLRALVGWIGETGGAWGLAAFIVIPFVGLAVFTRRSYQRDLARQYAADRTIHVEKPRGFSGPENVLLVVLGGGLWIAVAVYFVQAVVVTVR